MNKIVVGVDGSPSSRRALGWALAEAEAHDAAIEVLHAYPDLQSILPYSIEELTGGASAADRARAGHQLVQEMLDDVGVPPGVKVEVVVVEGPPANALVGRSTGTDLLVVGTRGHGGFDELLMGSVSHQAALHARCPVTIVPRAR